MKKMIIMDKPSVLSSSPDPSHCSSSSSNADLSKVFVFDDDFSLPLSRSGFEESIGG